MTDPITQASRLVALLLAGVVSAQGEATVAELKSGLSSKRADQRVEALQRAAELGPKAAPVLDEVVVLLTDDEDDVRLAAVAAVAAVRPDLAAGCAKLKPVLLVQPGRFGGRIGGRFGGRGRRPRADPEPEVEEVRRLVADLSQTDDEDRTYRALREVRRLATVPDDVVMAMISLVDSESRRVRRNASTQVGRATDHPVAFAAVLKALDHADDGVRSAALRALPVHDPERRAAALQPLLALLRDPRRPMCVVVLGKLSSFHDHAAEVAPAVVAVLERDPVLTAEVLETLGALRPESPEVIAAMARQLDSELEPNRTAAALALARCGPAAASALPALFAIVRDDVQKMRQAAVRAIARIGPDRADVRLVLIEALQDPVEPVASEAERCWQDLGIRTAK